MGLLGLAIVGRLPLVKALREHNAALAMLKRAPEGSLLPKRLLAGVDHAHLERSCVTFVPRRHQTPPHVVDYNVTPLHHQHRPTPQRERRKEGKKERKGERKEGRKEGRKEERLCSVGWELGNQEAGVGGCSDWSGDEQQVLTLFGVGLCCGTDGIGLGVLLT